VAAALAALTPAATDAAPAASGQREPGETIPANKSKATLERAVPGLQLQASSGELPVDGIPAKPALSEFMNRPPVALGSPRTFAGLVAGAATEPAAAIAATPAAQAEAASPLLSALAATLPAPPEPRSAPRTAAASSAGDAIGAAGTPGGAAPVRSAAPASGPAALPPRQDNPMSQVDGSIRWLLKNQDQSAELQLHPESLGRVQIKITVEGTQVHAKVWAAEAAALPVLQDHRAFLEASLKGQGLSLGSFDLQQGHKGEQAPVPTPQPAPAARISASLTAETGQETPAGPAAIPANPYRISIVA
jgi:flagellar hook-length control protein FliK